MKITATLALALLVGACSGEDLAGPALPTTTPGDMAMANLDARIAGLEGTYARTGNVDVGRALIDHLLTRTQFAGTYHDFGHAETIMAELVDARGETGELLVARAGVRGAQHFFDSAEADIVRARDLGTDIGDALTTVQLAVGRDLEDVVTIRRDLASAYPTYSALTSFAAAQAAVGEFAVADEYYQIASDSYRDVSPLPLAWVAFQRGVMWGEKADRADLARGFYEQAVALVPGYVVANVHLAELEAQDGDLDRAIARLERIAPTTLDPEPTGFLAELIADRDPDRSAELARRAEHTYLELFALYPRAFLDHGAEFFAAGTVARDPAMSLALALENLVHRQDARAYIVGIESALAGEDHSTACELAAAAQSIEGKNINLEGLIGSLSCD